MVAVKIWESEIENFPVCFSNGRILNSMTLKTDLTKKIKWASDLLFFWTSGEQVLWVRSFCRWKPYFKIFLTYNPSCIESFGTGFWRMAMLSLTAQWDFQICQYRSLTVLVFLQAWRIKVILNKIIFFISDSLVICKPESAYHCWFQTQCQSKQCQRET